MNCLLFAGSINGDGYGVIQVKTDGKWSSRNIHRIIYQNAYGDIPAGLVIDHICRNRSCINLNHLQAISNAENLRLGKLRLTHCKQGHAYTPENTYIRTNGARRCKACNVIHRRNNRHKKHSLVS